MLKDLKENVKIMKEIEVMKHSVDGLNRLERLQGKKNSVT